MKGKNSWRLTSVVPRGRITLATFSLGFLWLLVLARIAFLPPPGEESGSVRLQGLRPSQGGRLEHGRAMEEVPPPIPPEDLHMKVAICILTRRNGWDRRHLVRQTWLRDVPKGTQVGHIFVIGEDKSFTREENARLAVEVEMHGDILVAPAEESYSTLSLKTKHCLYWATQNSDFDILIKTDDDSTLFLGRLLPLWLSSIKRDDFVYFGKQHLPTKVANPANFAPTEYVNTDKYFEFEYRGVTWPEFMQGGMYGFSRALAEQMVKIDFWTYTSEDATVGVWMSALRPTTKYLEPEHLLYREDDYQNAQGNKVYVTFQTERLRLVSMWCEYEESGTLSTASILATNTHRALKCLRQYEEAMLVPRSTALVNNNPVEKENILSSLSQGWPITKPNLEETGTWWLQMGNSFRKRQVFVIGKSASAKRMPVYLLQGKHTLVFDDFFRMKERFMQWAPTMYMCIDPAFCNANAAEINTYVRPLFASFFPFAGEESEPIWEHIRQRVNVHWFMRDPGHHGLDPSITTGTGAPEHPPNFHVASPGPSLAVSLEILGYLGFSNIFMLAVEEELERDAAAVTEAARFVRNVYKTKVTHLHADGGGGGGDKPAAPLLPGKLFAAESFMGLATRLHKVQVGRSPNWDIEMFLQNCPAIAQVEIVRGASNMTGMFPSIARCHAFPKLNRFDPAVLCGMDWSLQFFDSYMESHVPHGPVRGYYLWLKR
ncbi:unnamed protein product [Discosporangium mesarthrocarpum]